MPRKKNKVMVMILIIMVWSGIAPSVEAMHIMEGYLPIKYCILWAVVCIPFLIASFLSIRKTVLLHRKTILILAMAGAYTFVLSALKIPSVTGSSSHPTGTGLGAILFGPAAMTIIGCIVLIFQAVLLAHGGLTTLGANTFSMAVAGPFISYLIYKGITKVWKNRNARLAAVFFAASLGDLFTYVVTSFQLASAHSSGISDISSSFIKFLSIFAVTQIPLAIIEGILTVIVIMSLEAYASTELKELEI